MTRESVAQPAHTRSALLRITVVALLSSVLAGLLIIAGTAPATVPAAWAAGSVTVINDSGTSTADPEYSTNVTVHGSGFQSIRNGFGGVYVLFGWVDDPSGSSWTPSAGGIVGANYGYVPDSESKDNAGFQRFVAFPGSDTASAAHAVMGDDGSWSVDMVIPGATFQAKDRNNNVTSIDCLQRSCGIITIGAHGVKNANNESFTPITFAAPSSGEGAASAGAGSAVAETAQKPAGELRVGIASAQIDAGTSIAFTGQGFTPGEQVVATLDNGLVSVGPLAAGAQGEVAGVLPVPYEVRGGTHVVTLTGAASNGIAQAEVTINPAAVTLDSAAAAEQMPAWLFVVLVTAILLALALIAVSLTMSILRGAKRRREQKAQAAALAEAQAEPQKQGADGFDSAGAIPSMWPTTFPPANDAPTIELPSVTTGSRS